MDEDRLKHSLAVAEKMKEIAEAIHLEDEKVKDCFAIGFNHDIGYEFAPDGVNHGKIGGNILKRTGFLFWQEVFYHGEPNCEYSSLYLDILNMADMQIDKYGNDVGYKKRLEDIGSRYGTESEVYKKCVALIQQTKEKLKKHEQGTER